MSLLKQIQTDIKDAMKAKAELKLSTLRMLKAAIRQREIDEQITLDDAGVLQVINKMIKQRRDAAAQFESANRSELADKEKQEVVILETYLPTQMNEAEIEAAVDQAIKTVGASDIKDMGKVMGQLKSQLAGKADMAVVSAKVKASLSG